MHYYAGIDIGTTHLKLVITDPQLRVVVQGKRGYRNGFGARLDANEMRGHCFDLLKEASAALPADATALFIGFSSAMHSVLLVDRNGAPLTELMTWADNSSQPWVEQHVASGPSVFNATGTPFHPMTPLAKLGWLRQSAPELLAQMHKAVGIKEFIWFHLTGKWEIDHSIASATGLFDIETRTWYTAALRLAGIGEKQLSVPVSVLHTVPLQAAFSFPCPVQLVIGGSDGCLAQLGSNLLQPGAAALTIGTSGAIRVTKPVAERDARGQLFTYILDEDYYVQGAPVNNGGLALQWWNHNVSGGSLDPAATMQAFEQDLAATTAGAGGLICIPWFAGERAPVWNAHASGSFHAVSTAHTRAHFGRSVLEGICFQFRLLMQLLERQTGSIDSIFASGGFTASKAWLQLMADILQRAVYVPASPVDASALGAIAMAMRAGGQIEHWQAFVRLNKQGFDVYHWQEQTKTVYDAQFNIFRELCRS
ncbi:MAG: gluconokinase [Flavihumibacter sp.]